MNLTRFYLLLFFLVLPALGRAETRVRAEVAPDEIGLEDELTLTVTVEDGSDVEDPVLPPMPAFKLASSASTSNFQFINGHMSSSKSFIYTLIPQTEGKITIGSITVKSGDRDYKTSPLVVTVNRNTQGAPPPQGRHNSPGYFPPADEGDEENAKPYWITATVSNKTPYAGEQVLYTFRFYRSVNTGGAALDLPDFSKFAVEDLTPEKQAYQEIKGVRYLVSEKSVALFALEPGPTSIDETILKVEIPEERSRSLFDDPFFGMGRLHMKQKSLRAPAITLDVKALPPAPPVDFTNLVGQFSLAASLSADEVKQGESVTLTIEVNGRGNIKEAALPKNEPIDGVKIYDDKPATDIIRKETGVDGKKTFKKAIVPEKEGEIVLPPVHFSFFDPQKGTYERLEGPAFTLKVTPGESQKLDVVSGPSDEAGQKTLPPSGPALEDIATVHANPILEPPPSLSPKVLNFLFWISPLVYVGVGLVSFIHKRRLAESGGRTGRIFNLYLKAVREVSRSDDVHFAARRLLEGVRDYLAAKSKTNSSGMTVPDMLEILRSLKGVDAALVSSFGSLVSALESHCFGGSSGSREEILKISSELTGLLKKVAKK